MPLIDLNDEDLYFRDSYNEMWLAMFYYKICSFAFFPKNKEERLDYMRHIFKRMLFNLTSNPLSKSEKHRERLYEYCNTLGDELAILESSNTSTIQKKLKRIFKEGMILGMALSGMHSLVKTSSKPILASKDKLAFLVENIHDCSRSKFFNILDRFDTVAHIWAAIYVESAMDGSPNNFDGQSNYIINDYNKMTDCILASSDFDDFCESRQGQMILNILVWSREFHAFGIDHIPLRSPKPVLNPATIWTVPDRVEGNPGTLPQLKPEVIKTLKGYRAPHCHPPSDPSKLI